MGSILYRPPALSSSMSQTTMLSLLVDCCWLCDVSVRLSPAEQVNGAVVNLRV